MAVASDIDPNALAVRRDERRTAAVACGAHALHDGYTDLIYVMLPIWQREFGLGFAELGLLRALFSGTMAGLQIPSGLIAERLGTAAVLALGTALAGAGYCLAGASTGLGLLIIALFVGGMGASTQHPLASALMAHAGGGVGKLVCAFIGARIGAIATVWLTEGLTAVAIVALLPLPLEAALLVLPLIGIALNGTSSVLYGSVPDLVAPARRARAFSIFYTGTIGAGALAPAIYGVVGDGLGVSTTLLVVAAILLRPLPLSPVLRPRLPRR